MVKKIALLAVLASLGGAFATIPASACWDKSGWGKSADGTVYGWRHRGDWRK
jgi:hypothetical protein